MASSTQCSNYENKFYFVEGKDFGYCVLGDDLLVGDLSIVETGSIVKFKYGKSTYSGSVLEFSDNEESILTAIKEKQKADKKLMKKSDSFHEGQPRKAALKLKEKKADLSYGKGSAEPKPSDSKTSHKRQRAKEAKVVKQLKDRSSLKTEQKLLEVLEVKDDVPEEDKATNSDDSDASSSASCCSSVSSVSLKSRKRVKVHNMLDAELLNSLKSGESSEGNGKGSSKAGENSLKSSVREKSYRMEQGEGMSKDKKGTKEQAGKDLKKASKDRKKRTECTERKREKTIEINNEEEKKIETEHHKTEEQIEESSDDRASLKEGGNSGVASNSDQAESSDDEALPRKKRAGKNVVAKRNMDIYPGQNYSYSKNDSGVVKVHEDYDVYVKKKHLDAALRAKTQSQYCRNLLDKIYTTEALKGSTLLGYPPRGKGAASYKGTILPPRLHPDGIAALSESCLKVENTNKKWRPRTTEAVIAARLAGRLWELK